jgi:hypothetical protein
MMHLEDRAARIRPNAASNLLLWCIAGFFALAILWACFTQLDRTVHGQGRVIPTARLQTVSIWKVVWWPPFWLSRGWMWLRARRSSSSTAPPAPLNWAAARRQSMR